MRKLTHLIVSNVDHFPLRYIEIYINLIKIIIKAKTNKDK